MYYLYIDNEKKFSLTRFAPLDFTENTTLYIKGDDLKGLKESFSNFKSIAVYKNDIEVMYSESFDGYSHIQFNESVYCDDEDQMCDELTITLTKKNLIDQIKALDEQLNPVIHFEKLNLPETKAIIKSRLNDSCQKAIFSGVDVTLSTGETQHFSFTDQDQNNIESAALLVMKDPSIAELPYPYHGDTKRCMLYNSADILNLYVQMKLKITQETTYCNLIKSYVDTLSTTEEVTAITYGTPLSEELQEVYNEMMTASNNIAKKLYEVVEK